MIKFVFAMHFNLSHFGDVDIIIIWGLFVRKKNVFYRKNENKASEQ